MNKSHKFSAVSAWVLTAVCIAPYLVILWKSMRSQDGFTGAYYYEVFLSENQYLRRFWQSLALACAIAAVQVAVPPWRATASPSTTSPEKTSFSSA